MTHGWFAGECRLKTFGSFEFSVERRAVEISKRKTRALLAYMVMHTGAEIPRERLVEVFWRNTPLELARGSLKTALWEVRAALRAAGRDPTVFFRADRSVVLWGAPVEHDVKEFLIRAVLDTPASRAEALEIYRGEYLEGNYEDWPSEQRRQLASEYEQLIARMAVVDRNTFLAAKLRWRDEVEPGYFVLNDVELGCARLAKAQA